MAEDYLFMATVGAHDKQELAPRLRHENLFPWNPDKG
jgi:hypothetical protein